MSIDLDFSYKKASEKIQSLKTFKEISDAAKTLENANQKIPFDQFNTNIKSPLFKSKNPIQFIMIFGSLFFKNLNNLYSKSALKQFNCFLFNCFLFNCFLFN